PQVSIQNKLAHHIRLTFPTRRSSDLDRPKQPRATSCHVAPLQPREPPRAIFCLPSSSVCPHTSNMRRLAVVLAAFTFMTGCTARSEEHTSELQSRGHLEYRP